MKKSKKIIVGIMFAVGLFLIVGGLIKGMLNEHNKRREEALNNPPTYTQVEKDMEFWLLSSYIDASKREIKGDYAIYRIHHCSMCTKYYKAVYVLKSENAFNYYWEFSHIVGEN